MHPADATSAAVALARSLGLAVDDVDVLHASNKVTLRLRPADVVARVAPLGQQNAAFELEIAHQLTALGAPVARPHAGVHEQDGNVVTLWAYYAPAAPYSPAGYAAGLSRLHAGMREVRVDAPHVLDRVGDARHLVADRELTPTLAEPDRSFLAGTLDWFGSRVAGSGRDQLLHGEPHPGNVLATADGPVFVDLETCCRGPVEFDLAYASPDAAEHYPGLDPDLLAAGRVLGLALDTTWRWDVGDLFPDGARLGREWLAQLRADVSAYEARPR